MFEVAKYLQEIFDTDPLTWFPIHAKTIFLKRYADLKKGVIFSLAWSNLNSFYYLLYY